MKHFDAQNPLIGSLIREVDIGKKKGLSKFLDKAPDIRDLSLCLDLINSTMERNFFNRGDDNNDNNNNNDGNDFLPPPPSPPNFDFPNETGQRPLPKIGSLLNDNFNNFRPPPPPPPPLPPFQTFFQPPPLQRAPDVIVRRKNDTATNTTQTMSGDRLLGGLKRVIEKEKPNI